MLYKKRGEPISVLTMYMYKIKSQSINIRRILMLAFIIFYTIALFMKITDTYNIYVNSCLQITTILCFISCIIGSDKSTLILGGIFLIVGSFLLVITQSTFDLWLEGIQKTLDVLSVLIFSRFLAMPFELGPFKSELAAVINKNVNNNYFFYIMVLILIILFGGFVNLAIIPLAFYLIDDILRNNYNDADRLLATIIKRGAIFALSWSPFSVIMAVPLECNNIPWIRALPYSILYIIIGLAISLLFLSLGLERIEKQKDVKLGKETIGNFTKNLAIYFAYIMLLLISIFLLTYLFHFGIIDSIIIISLFVPFIWVLFQGKINSYWQVFNKFTQVDLPNMHNNFIIFVSAGVFVIAMERIGLAHVIMPVFQNLQQVLGYYCVYFLIPLLAILLIGLGLPHFVVLMALSENIDISLLNVQPLIFAFLLIVGGTIGILLSPFSATNLMISSLVKKDVFSVSLKWNYLYSVLLLIVTISVLVLSVYSKIC